LEQTCLASLIHEGKSGAHIIIAEIITFVGEFIALSHKFYGEDMTIRTDHAIDTHPFIGQLHNETGSALVIGFLDKNGRRKRCQDSRLIVCKGSILKTNHSFSPISHSKWPEGQSK
jgi:hypothetical protein